MAELIIPSVFTAIDGGLSSTVERMRSNVIGFGQSAEAAMARTDRVVRKLTPALGHASKELLHMFGAAAIGAGIFRLGEKSIESLQGYEVAVDAFKVKVSGLNDLDFSVYQKEIDSVAKTTQKSGEDVAKSFEKIAGLNPELAKTASGLGEVSTAVIVLAEAGKMELGAAAESLVGTMNQFSLGAHDAERAINALAAGQSIGASNINLTSEALGVFGKVAHGANISLEQSIGLTETLAKFQIYGADAGTKLTQSIIRLQKAGLGYKSGQFNLNDALEQTNTILNKAKDAKMKDAIISKVFGIRQQTTARILLSNVDVIKRFSDGVTGTESAERAAQIQTTNLHTAIERLGTGWENILTGSDKARSGITQAADAVRFLTANLSEIVSVGFNVIKFYLEYKAVMLAAKGAMFVLRGATLALNIVEGIQAGLIGVTSYAMLENTVAMKAMSVTTAIATGDIAALNTALGLTPIGWLIIGIGALTAGIIYLTKVQAELRAEYERSINVRVLAGMSGEEKLLNSLIDKYTKLGTSRKEAAAMAIYQERINIDLQRSKNKAELETMHNELRQKELHLPNGVVFNLPGGDAIQEKINKKQQEETVLAGRSLELTNFVIAHTQKDAEKPSQAPFSETDKFSKNEANKIYTTSNDDAANEATRNDKLQMTLIVKNDSDSQVSLMNGKTEVANVMPKVSSTKVIDKYLYGR